MQKASALADAFFCCLAFRKEVLKVRKTDKTSYKKNLYVLRGGSRVV